MFDKNHVTLHVQCITSSNNKVWLFFLQQTTRQAEVTNGQADHLHHNLSLYVLGTILCIKSGAAVRTEIHALVIY